MDFILCSLLAIATLYLISAILKHKSYVGVSAKTQLLYTVALVVQGEISILYILLIAFPSIVAFTLAFKMRDTYEKEVDSFWAEILLIAAFILSVYVQPHFSSFGVLSTFSDNLETVAFIPQLYMIWNSKGTTKHMKVYIHLLFLYKLVNLLWLIYLILIHNLDWLTRQYNIKYSTVVILNFLILSVAVLTVRSKRILHCEEENMDTKAQNIFVITSGLTPPITLTKPNAVTDATNEANKPLV